MSRFLAVDWDHQQLHVVAGQVRRGVLRIERTAFVQETQSPNPAEAEALGKLLRERIEQAGITPAPVLACIGRDRVIVKEVRYPAVSASEEPAVVRFQAAKELSSHPDEVVIDYMPLAGGAAAAEKRALVFIVRCEMLAAYLTLCKSAGLKLHALTPRPFGTIASLRGSIAPSGDGGPSSVAAATTAVVTLAPRWSEFCVASGEQLLLARTLGDKPVDEVRRHVTVFNSYSPEQSIQSVYLVNGGDPAMRERLHQSLKVPVLAFDPLAGLERSPLPALPPQVGEGGGGRQAAGFAGPVGLLCAYASGKLPVNFAAPKQVRSAKDPNRLRALLAAVAAAALVLAAIVFGFSQSVKKKEELAAERLIQADLEGQLAQLETDAKAISALNEWTSGEINLLDEFYDLTDRFPSTETMRLTLLSVTPLSRAEKSKEKHVAKISFKGVSTEDIRQVDQFLERMDADGHYRVDPKQVSASSDKDKGTFTHQFSAQADIVPRKPGLYARRLPVSLETASTAPAPIPPSTPTPPGAAVASQPAAASDAPQAAPGAPPAPAVNPQPAVQPAPPGGPIFRRARGEPKMMKGAQP